MLTREKFHRFRIVTWNIGQNLPTCVTFKALSFDVTPTSSRPDFIVFGCGQSFIVLPRSSRFDQFSRGDGTSLGSGAVAQIHAGLFGKREIFGHCIRLCWIGYLQTNPDSDFCIDENDRRKTCTGHSMGSGEDVERATGLLSVNGRRHSSQTTDHSNRVDS